jgi:hypothetical protein
MEQEMETAGIALVSVIPKLALRIRVMKFPPKVSRECFVRTWRSASRSRYGTLTACRQWRGLGTGAVYAMALGRG